MTTHQTLGSPARFRAGAVSTQPSPYLMPFAEAVFASKLLIVVMSMIPFGVVAIAGNLQGPAAGDYWAIAGAGFAAMLSGLQVLSRRRPYRVLAMHLGSSGVVGTLGPGFCLWLVHICHPTSHEFLLSTLTWQAHAFFGFAFGLGGWSIVHAIINRWERHADGIVGRPFNHFDKP